MSSSVLSTAGRWMLNRRDFLRFGGTGLSGVALLSLLREGEPLRDPRFVPKAKNVLLIFASGALSHIDSWDYKPELIRRHGQPLPGTDKLITFQGENGNLARPLWEFKPRGQTGKMVSDMLPHLASLADDLCFIHSMTAKSNTHGPAENQMSTGFTLDGFPSMGSWVSYALGSACRDLPAFVAIPDPRGVPQVGPNHWNSGFLPAVYQGTAFNADKPIPNLATPRKIKPKSETAARDFLKFLNDEHLKQHPGDSELSARIASYELAARMQLSAAEVADLSRETRATLDLYGASDSNKLKAGFARNCILARRLIERGVRFVQLFNGAYAMGEGVGNWDGHKKLKEQYDIHAPILDQPCSALITDLKSRGLLESTLVVFVTEFGRMPTFQKDASGRDHNPHGFTVWLTGAGVKRGFSHGATDEFGHRAATDVCTIYDLHATILHLLGLDHERLTFYHNGVHRRLTDVHGQVINEILA
ncbi:MAG TPA: DUF1501 domain-containing protein [Candidatus Binatia bacterium]|nr:DUF1501 domain-containing protein [Candidatus Binatia bacterium]